MLPSPQEITMQEFYDQKFIAPLINGTIIEEYQVLRCLGQGGFGTTYFCQDNNLKRYCVIKEFTPQKNAFRDVNPILRPILKKDFDSGLTDFLFEAQHIALFNHPNITRINRYFSSNGTGYFVMDYESGESLRQLIQRRNSSFEEIEIEMIIFPLCNGLSQLHSKSLIHRDIKPDNIIIRSDGSPILIDFGAIGDLKSINAEDYKIYVTPNYAPIEQFYPTLNQGSWIDIYALGATLYELIAGFPPPSSLERIHNDNIIPITEIGRGNYSNQILNLIDRSLCLDYKLRPKSINEFLSFFKFDKYKSLRDIIHSITLKATEHFLNWAKPNPGLLLDEFVSFITGFSILDLTWRLGKGNLLDRDLFEKIIDQNLIDEIIKMFTDSGFNSQNRIINKNTVKDRLEEYAATYLLDRQEQNWTYTLTRKQCAKNCINSNFSSDNEGFMELLEDVIDRYRGRIKKELGKLNIQETSTTNN